MNNYVYFDMDGTISDLYGVHNVFNRLDNLDATPYLEAKPINKYINMLKEFKTMGYHVCILSCLGIISEDKFDKDTIHYKNEWLNRYIGSKYIDERIYIPNTKHKEQYITHPGILVDDDDRVLVNWNGDRIKAINDNKMLSNK